MQPLVLLKVVAVVLFKVWQLPRDDILFTFCCVCPAVPSEGTLMNNARDLVHKIGQVGLEHIRIVDKLVDLANHEDGIDLGSWDHNLQVTITRRYLVSNYQGT